MTDKELIEDIIHNNSQRAFEDLVNRYQKMVLKTCLGFVSNHSDAEDLAQEVFIEVFESLQGFRNESKISTWIYRIAVNKSLNQVRKQKRERMFRSIESFFTSKEEKSEKIELVDIKGDMADTEIIRRENKQMLKNAISKLPENQRIAFVLSKYQDLSYKEIAEVMNVTLSSVESLLFRAKSNLQKHLLDEIKK
jgi:RNA polymerase sigma-70 factor, ECF subfamily